MATYTVQEIKKIITDIYISNETIQRLYNLDNSKTFEEQFSKTSIESNIFYCVAYIGWFILQLFNVHKTEVDAELNNRLVPNSSWWQRMILLFQFPNRELISETDRYDNTGLSADDIEALQVVKFCAIEDTRAKVRIKVAKGSIGNRTPISDEELTGLTAYIERFRPAGIDYEIINRQADKIFADIVVYYNPLALNPIEKPVETAFKNYIQTIEFNGLLSTTWLADALQAVNGVILLDLKYIKIQRALNPWEDLGVQKIAESGYWIVENESDLIITYIPYTTGNINENI